MFRHFCAVFLCIAAAASCYLGSARSQTRDSVARWEVIVPDLLTLEHKPLRFGGSAAYQLNQFNIGTLPPDIRSGCDNFLSASGTSYSFDFRTDIPYWDDLSDWSFAPRLAYQRTTGPLKFSQTVPVFDSVNRERKTELAHTINVSAGFLSLKPYVSYSFGGGLRAEAGPALEYLLHSHYSKVRSILTPGDNWNGQTSRVESEGKLPGRNHFGLRVGGALGYELPLSRSSRAFLAVDASLPLVGLTDYLGETRVAATLSLLFDLTPRYESYPVFTKQVRYDTVHLAPAQPPAAHLSGSISAVAIGSSGESLPIVTLSIEEVRAKDAFPILNYIFFSESSSQIPSRYVQYKNHREATEKFRGSSERENIDLLSLYHETLNILGDRLRLAPNATVTLTGMTSNTGGEESKLSLAAARAEAVQHYLQSVWKIEPGRIKIRSRLLPQFPSPSRLPEGQAENRRVEFTVNDESVTDPIIVYNTEHIATPDKIRLQPVITADTGIASIDAFISNRGEVLANFHGDAHGFGANKVWSPTEETMRRFVDSLSLTMVVLDSAGHTLTVHGSIPLKVEQVTKEKPEQIEKFSLILFDFDDTKIRGKNERIVSSVVNAVSSFEPKRILIVGHTDELGEEAYNNTLSKQRAEEARRDLLLAMPPSGRLVPKILTEGRGARDPLFDNSLPEGRFYSRTVNITLEKRSE